MKKISFLFACALFCGLGSRAYSTDMLETLPGRAELAFFAAKEARPRLPSRYRIVKCKRKHPVPDSVGGTHVLHLSGRAFLAGSGAAPSDRGSVWVYLSARVKLTDDEGHFVDGTVEVSDSRYFPILGREIRGYSYPQAFADVYEGGTFLGTVLISGTIPVSGFVMNHAISVSGSGFVYGSLSVPDPKP